MDETRLSEALCSYVGGVLSAVLLDYCLCRRKNWESVLLVSTDSHLSLIIYSSPKWLKQSYTDENFSSPRLSVKAELFRSEVLPTSRDLSRESSHSTRPSSAEFAREIPGHESSTLRSSNKQRLPGIVKTLSPQRRGCWGFVIGIPLFSIINAFRKASPLKWQDIHRLSTSQI